MPSTRNGGAKVLLFAENKKIIPKVFSINAYFLSIEAFIMYIMSIQYMPRLSNSLI